MRTSWFIVGIPFSTKKYAAVHPFPALRDGNGNGLLQLLLYHRRQRLEQAPTTYPHVMRAHSMNPKLARQDKILQCLPKPIRYTVRNDAIT
ncbi:uncharacterized protein METZ01_LOCUS427914 [marine metagenome]|uniref:Uncharacterized protein n=1 Tax=marine metagenome TaxID=408172 RepID=A0A382XW23_9ZZZZ